MKQLLGFLLLTCCVGSYAAVVTFDEPFTPFSGAGQSTTTQGFEFDFGADNTAQIFVGGGVSCSPDCPLNGTRILQSFDSGLHTAVTMSRSDGRPFNLRQFDAAESHVGLDFEATQIDVIGTRMGGSTVLASFVLDQVNDGSGPLLDFQTFVVPRSFSGLVSVSFNGSGGIFDGPTFFRDDFALDNIVIVPEPATLALLGIAIAGLVWRRRTT